MIAFLHNTGHCDNAYTICSIPFITFIITNSTFDVCVNMLYFFYIALLLDNEELPLKQD